MWKVVTALHALHALHPAVYHLALSSIGSWQSFVLVVVCVVMSNGCWISFCPSWLAYLSCCIIHKAEWLYWLWIWIHHWLIILSSGVCSPSWCNYLNFAANPAVCLIVWFNSAYCPFSSNWFISTVLSSTYLVSERGYMSVHCMGTWRGDLSSEICVFSVLQRRHQFFKLDRKMLWLLSSP